MANGGCATPTPLFLLLTVERRPAHGGRAAGRGERGSAQTRREGGHVWLESVWTGAERMEKSQSVFCLLCLKTLNEEKGPLSSVCNTLFGTALNDVGAL